MDIAAVDINETTSFCLTVSFQQDITSPHLLFQSISDMILELQAVDRSLVRCIDSKIEPVFVLDEVEKGSIKVWLKQLLNNIPDEALTEMDAKKVLGSYLVRGKYKILEKMSESDSITDVRELDSLATDLQSIARSTNVLIADTIVCVDQASLLRSMNNIGKIANQMPAESKFYYSADTTESKALIINNKFESPDAFLSEVIEERTIVNKSIMILKVKQPDYLGNSQWVFRYDNSRLTCGFEDSDWLKRFHSREIDVRPGDSLKVVMETSTVYDKRNDVVFQKNTIIEVIDVVPVIDHEQLSINQE